MYRTNFLIGATIGIMTVLLVLNMPHPVNASTCTSSASAGGVQNQRYLGSASLMQFGQHKDQGCSASSVGVGGPGGGTACVAANNGGGGIGTSGGSSCSISNHNQFAINQLARAPSAQAAPGATAK